MTDIDRAELEVNEAYGDIVEFAPADSDYDAHPWALQFDLSRARWEQAGRPQRIVVRIEAAESDATGTGDDEAPGAGSRRWTSFTTEELHALARGFDVADHESLIDERGPDRELWRGVWDELDARGAWAGWQGADRP